MFDRPAAVARRLKAPLLLAGAMFALWALLQLLLFRSGAYWLVAQPDSNTGAVVHALLSLDTVYRPERRTVLVFGDSRIGEGFSASVAAGEGDIDFVNLSVPGSTARTWYYLLREIDRRGYRYDAIALGTLYRPTDRNPSIDWPLDPAHQVALLGLRDVFDYPATFRAGPPRDRARRAVLFPALTVQEDLRGFLASPLERLRWIRKNRASYINDTLIYPGRSERLPALAFDGHGMPMDLSATTPELHASIEREAGSRDVPIPPDTADANTQFLVHWTGEMARLAKQHGARTFVFQIPRGPYPALLAMQEGTPPLLEAASRMPSTEAFPPGLLMPLEAPDYFFDLLHLNGIGRERMSRVVGEEIRARLDAEPR